MSTIQTDMRDRMEWMQASRIPYEASAGITADNVQDAIEAVQANAAAAASSPPAITPKSITFAMSPYTILPTDYLLEVDTTGGVVVLNTGASAARGNRDFIVKDIAGNSAVNAISVVRTGAETIDGMTTYPMDTPYDAKTFTPKLAGNGYEVSA